MNSLAAIVELLKADTGIAALVSTRVQYGAMRHISKANSPLILVQRIGGENNIEDETGRKVIQQVFQVDCYGDGQPAADAVYEAVRALDGQVNLETTNYLFPVVEFLSLGQDIAEDAPGSDSETWDRVYCTLRLEIISK